jgi:hypothetical protein
MTLTFPPLPLNLSLLCYNYPELIPTYLRLAHLDHKLEEHY